MNLLARAKPSAHLIFSSPSPGQRLFYVYPLTALQQCNFYSTKTTLSSQRTQQSTKPRTQKSSGSSSSFSQRIRKQKEELTNVWPKPQPIPYQAKVANFVNLIGYVKMPVLFEAASDGKHFATTVISLGNVGERYSLSIPVVFEGDLAHVVACHVKESDSVFVSGLLSADPIRLVLGESLGKFHVVAENLNFVEGLEKYVVDKKIGLQKNPKSIEEVVERVDNDVYFNQQLKDVFKNSKTKDESSFSIENSVKPSMIADAEPAPEAKPYQKSEESVSKKKDGDQILNLWWDLVKNPHQWWDYRDHKSKGLVKERFPDFKQKGSGESIWISTAPKWVLPGIGKLEFDVKDVKPMAVQGGGEMKKFGKPDDSWKNLVENPDKWYDNRAKKRNPKAPDFKHKETGEGLWVDKLPAWALSRLPPIKDGQNAV